MTNQEWIEMADHALFGNIRPAPIVLTEGSGCRVKDVEGRHYLDLCAGVAVVSVGHGHPLLADAIAMQARRLMHVSNLFYNDRSIELADAIVKRTGFGRVFFCNSGAEANEALLKLARRYHYDRNDRSRTHIVATAHSFHGRTMGALSMTGQPKYHEGMGPLVGDIEHVPYGDLVAMKSVVGARTAAVIVEPIQGEGGVVVPPDDYLAGLRALCDAQGALLLFDEVQTGYARTGRFLGREWSGVWPDACALAKGIGAGFPLGAMAVSERLANALPPGTHATTYGGNPLACAAGLAVLEIIAREDLVRRADQRGVYLAQELAGIAADPTIPAAQASRGRGLLQGLVLAPSVAPAAVLTEIREQGVLLSLAGGNVLRFTPPLCVTEDELAEGVAVVKRVLKQVAV